MREKRRHMGIGIGGASILAIFVVLCLTTFATLSLVSARADARLAEKSRTASTEYYAADLLAEQMLGDVAAVLESGEDIPEKFSERGILWQQETGGAFLLQFEVSINEIKTLQVSVRAKRDESGRIQMKKTQWMVQVSPAEGEGLIGAAPTHGGAEKE